MVQRSCEGYNQIPGVDFTESFAPTANDTTLRTMFIITLSYSDEDGWTIEVIDIDTAFLEAELKEEVWIEIPDGYEFAFSEIDWTRYVMLLLKAMYALVQARAHSTRCFGRSLRLRTTEWCKARQTCASSTSKTEMESLRQ